MVFTAAAVLCMKTNVLLNLRSGVGYPKVSIEGSERPYDHLAAYQKSGQDHECSLSTKGIFCW